MSYSRLSRGNRATAEALWRRIDNANYYERQMVELAVSLPRKIRKGSSETIIRVQAVPKWRGSSEKTYIRIGDVTVKISRTCIRALRINGERIKRFQLNVRI